LRSLLEKKKTEEKVKNDFSFFNMTHIHDREKAISLRKNGASYSQIKQVLKVSKSTLSYWLRSYPLSRERIRALRDKNEKRIERFRNTMRKKKERRLNVFYEQQHKFIFPFDKKSFYLAGLFLYWGEGSKCTMNRLSFSNTDPSMIKFFIYWLTKSLFIPSEKIKIQLHLYKDMNVKKELDYWSKFLNIPLRQFNRPYIKKSLIKNINHKGGFGHGTCTVKVGNTRITERVLMGIKVIKDKYMRT